MEKSTLREAGLGFPIVFQAKGPQVCAAMAVRVSGMSCSALSKSCSHGNQCREHRQAMLPLTCKVQRGPAARTQLGVCLDTVQPSRTGRAPWALRPHGVSWPLRTSNKSRCSIPTAKPGGPWFSLAHLSTTGLLRGPRLGASWESQSLPHACHYLGHFLNLLPTD